MAREYLKKATLTAQSGASDVHDIVTGILNDIEAGGDEKALEYAAKFDNYDGNVILTEEEIAAACDQVSDKLKADIQFSHDNVKRFAEQQKATLADVEYEVVPGLIEVVEDFNALVYAFKLERRGRINGHLMWPNRACFF